jgi:uncharacterized protein
MPTFLTAEWRKLLMAQYVVAPETLAPWVPTGLELDLFQTGNEARCYVSLVGFLFNRVRIKGLPVPLHTSFEEVNLRFYVRHTTSAGEVRRGVVFLSEIVPRFAVSCIARTFYGEPYTTARILSEFHEISALDQGEELGLTPEQTQAAGLQDKLHVSYAWRKHHRWHTLAVEADPASQPIAPCSEEEFITEHYWGYTRRANGSTSGYEVRHPRWQVYSVRSTVVDVDFGALYGPAFTSLNHAQPSSVLLAEGSSVSVLSGFRL